LWVGVGQAITLAGILNAVAVAADIKTTFRRSRERRNRRTVVVDSEGNVIVLSLAACVFAVRSGVASDGRAHSKWQERLASPIVVPRDLDLLDISTTLPARAIIAKIIIIPISPEGLFG
jgi:hypothetical protein